MEELIKELETVMAEAEKYKSCDSGMEYAYKYGMLTGAIKSAIIELEHLKKMKK